VHAKQVSNWPKAPTHSGRERHREERRREEERRGGGEEEAARCMQSYTEG